MSRQHLEPSRKRRHAEGQRSIRRTCACGRVIVGNAAWHSHLSVGRPECTDLGRAFDDLP